MFPEVFIHFFGVPKTDILHVFAIHNGCVCFSNDVSDTSDAAYHFIMDHKCKGCIRLFCADFFISAGFALRTSFIPVIF